MNKEDEIKRLTKELEQIGEQLQSQQEHIQQLQQQIQGLAGNEIISTPRQTSPPKRTVENFIGLNVIHVIGIIVLVVGLSIGVKYAIDRQLISELMRISLAYSAGVVLFIFSYRLKKKYLLFSSILFSGAMASLYFTTYAAYVYYQLMPFGFAFAFMVLLTVFTIFQALNYQRQEIALLGFIGAYAIPFLISKNSDRADLFFAYISLINVGVVYLAAKKQWRLVGKVAQYVTWVLFIGWAAIRFTPALQNIGAFFMLFFFSLFLFDSVSPGMLHKQNISIRNIYHVVLNNIALYLAALFIYGASFDYATLAAITLVMAVIAAGQATAFHYLWHEERAKKMVATYGFILFVASIAFQWKGITVTLLWLLLAVIVFTLGIYRKWVSLRMTAIVLLGATLFKLVVFDSRSFTTVQKVISYLILGVLLLLISFFYQKFREQLFKND